uniref:Chondroadherin-like protein n=1 Tax=Petromyzon marinus TaxID=7757 RepID=A0AAJ7XII8_PETMA|nr:chondroadherin-like protein [Petromyzon marinus]
MKPEATLVPGGVLRLVVFGPALPPLGTETFRAADLSVLQRLDLSFNNISWAPADAFAPLHTLLSLELNNNRLTALPAGVFSNLSHLRVLDISSNLVESIAPGAFSGLVSLRLLNLSRNALAALASLARPAGVLPAGGGGGRDAVTVAVAAAAALGTTPGPEATMIGPFTGLSLRSHLDLSHNRLSQLGPGADWGLAGPGSVRLHGNPWDCSCRLQEFVLWLKNSSSLSSSSTAPSSTQDGNAGAAGPC